MKHKKALCMLLALVLVFSALMLLPVIAVGNGLYSITNESNEENCVSTQYGLLLQLFYGNFIVPFNADGEPVNVPSVNFIIPPEGDRNYFVIGVEGELTDEYADFILSYTGIPREFAYIGQATFNRLVLELCNDEVVFQPQYNQESTLQMNNELNGIRIISELYNLLPIDETGSVIYPDFYAGSFHDPNDRSLIMNIVNDSENLFTMGNPIYDLATQNNITINVVDFSYAELFEMLHFLDSILIREGLEYSTRNNPYNLDFISEISSWGLPTDVNRVVVRFASNLEENASLFREHIIDSPMIIFEEGHFATLLHGDFVFFDNEVLETTRPNQ